MKAGVHHIEVPESTMLCEPWLSSIMVTWIVLGKAVCHKWLAPHAIKRRFCDFCVCLV